VDRLIMTNVVDNIYDIFAKGGKLDTITVQRAPFAFGVATPLAEFELAYHLESLRGAERREVITSCGHAGVINSVRKAQKASGIAKVHAVVGASTWPRHPTRSSGRPSPPSERSIPTTSSRRTAAA
jgi:metal-dependent hydrolase (beta-lactamase superfamily II)